MFQITESYIVALFMACIFFGIACVTYVLSMQTLMHTPFKNFNHARWLLFVVSGLVTLLSGIGVATQLRHVLVAFVYWKGAGGPTEQLVFDIKDPTNVIHAITYPLQCFLGDSILIHRTWFVYGRNWWIIITPMILLMANTACGFLFAAAEINLDRGNVSDPTIVPWTTSFLSLTVAQNVLCTSLICWKIWTVGKAAPDALIPRHRSLNNLIRIIVESGMIYTITTIILLVLVVLRDIAVFTVADAYIPITAICFHLIIIRTGNRPSEAWTTHAASGSKTALDPPPSTQSISFPLKMLRRDRRAESQAVSFMSMGDGDEKTFGKKDQKSRVNSQRTSGSQISVNVSDLEAGHGGDIGKSPVLEDFAVDSMNRLR